MFRKCLSRRLTRRHIGQGVGDDSGALQSPRHRRHDDFVVSQILLAGDFLQAVSGELELLPAELRQLPVGVVVVLQVVLAVPDEDEVTRSLRILAQSQELGVSKVPIVVPFSDGRVDDDDAIVVVVARLGGDGSGGEDFGGGGGGGVVLGWGGGGGRGLRTARVSGDLCQCCQTFAVDKPVYLKLHGLFTIN